ncbi:MAG: hypothetical protein ACRDTW_15205 [Rhodococcus qingshengii]|jgi:hypothetical protein
MLQAPIDHELNLVTQSVLVYASWALTGVFLVLALRWGRSERTTFYVLMVLAAMVGAFAEPLYDVGMMLYFYSTDGMITHYTAFGIPQPIWTHSGYVVLYASAAIFIARRIWLGTLTRKALYIFAGVEFLMSCTFEMIGINGNAYAYWGPHELRILDYPLAIGVLEAAQVVTFAVSAALLRRYAKNLAGLLGLFVIFPITFFGVNFGAGWPMIVALHLENTSATIVAVGTAFSILLALCVIRGAAYVATEHAQLPAPQRENVQV